MQTRIRTTPIDRAPLLANGAPKTRMRTLLCKLISEIDNRNRFRQIGAMPRAFSTTLVFAILAISAVRSLDASEIVIAIRYLQAEGTSHSHLYLYREDGKLLRQLTNDNSGQDSAPVFSPGGETIVFAREKPNHAREFWSIQPRGINLKKLEAAPDWYTSGKSSPYFTNVEPEESASPSPSVSPEETAFPTATPIPTYKSPDNSV
jgi:hypothetical protein